MSVIICLDPGHVRNYNHGAYGPYYEGTKMYELAVMLKEEIDKYDGLTAIITRKNVDDNPELYMRARMAKNAGARCFLSLHTNAASNPNINQVTLFRSVEMPSSEALGWKLENAIYSLINQDVPTTKYPRIATRLIQDGNRKGQDYYGVLRNSTGGSVKESLIIEHVYHTNYEQAKWMYDSNNLRKLAQVEAKVLYEYYADLIKSENEGIKESTITDTGSYVVKKGDSWWKIAANEMGSGAKMNELAAYNGMTIKNTLMPGQVIKIPVVIKTSNYRTYTVKTGDSWWKIAANEMGSGAKYKSLMEYNNMSVNDVLKVGAVIKIPV